MSLSRRILVGALVAGVVAAGVAVGAASAAGGGRIEERGSADSFFAVPPDQLTRHYAQAKVAVATWLDRTGRKGFYSRLAEMREGKSFEAIWAE